MNARTVTALVGVAIGIALAAPIPSAHASTRTERVYAEAQWLMKADHVKVPWDGRYQHSARHAFCVETFNGSAHDILQYGHPVPPGFYVKFCEDGNWFVNDGLPFKGMAAY